MDTAPAQIMNRKARRAQAAQNKIQKQRHCACCHGPESHEEAGANEGWPADRESRAG